MKIIKYGLMLLILTAGARGPGKQTTIQARDTNQPDTNNVVTGGLSAYFGFGEMEIIKLDYGLRCLLVADFDGDGRNDMAIANNQKSAIELLLQKEAKGLEEQQVAVDPNDIDINAIVSITRFHRQTLPVSQRIYALVCGDLNSDGLVDLAFYGEPRGLYVILQKPGGQKRGGQKTIEWQQRKRINIDYALPSENALTCADIDNDGKKDLILAGRDTVYIVFQKQDGTLGEPVKYPAAARILGIDVGDLNGDGKNDLVIFTDDLERPIHLRMGQKTNQLGPEIRLFAESPVAAEISNIDPGVSRGDEIVAIDAISRRLTCYKFTTYAGTPGQSKTDDWPVLFYPLAAGEGSEKRDLAVCDVDGDDLADVVISDPGAAELLLFKQASGIGLIEPVRFPSLADSDSLSAADIDGDGKSEVAVLSVKERVIGISKFTDGRLSFPKTLDIAGEPLAMELADVDGDGAVDCVYISRSQADSRSFRIVYNAAKPQVKTDANTDAEAGPVNSPQSELPRLAANPQGIKVIDVDQDGLKDVLVFVKYELPILIHQKAKREFELIESPKAQNSLLKEATVRSISVSDVDGKKGNELLIAQNNFARSLVFADGSWIIYDQYNAKSAENRISAAAAINIYGGKKDKKFEILLLDGQKSRLQILAAGDDNAYHFEKEIDTGTWTNPAGVKMAPAWLTGKAGKSRTPEILLFDGEKFAIVETSGNQGDFARLERKFSYETKIKDGSYGLVTTGDINGDGVDDIILVEYKNNHIEILTQNPAGNPVAAFAFKVFEDKAYRESRQPTSGVEPSQLKVADVTGDGSADLIAVIHDRIIIYPQD